MHNIKKVFFKVVLNSEKHHLSTDWYQIFTEQITLKPFKMYSRQKKNIYHKDKWFLSYKMT